MAFVGLTRFPKTAQQSPPAATNKLQPIVPGNSLPLH